MEYNDAVAVVIDGLIGEAKKEGRTTVDLARACGVSKQSVYKWRRGLTSMNIERLPAFCRFFGITPTDFFEMCDEVAHDDTQD